MGTHDRPTHGGYPAARAEGLTELPRVPASPAPGAPRREIPIEIKPAEFMPADTVLIVQPGDTLIMRYARPMDLATADRVKQHVHRLLPQLAEVVVMSGVEQLAVYRPREESPTPPYVHNLVTAFLDGSPLDFGGNAVPPDVRARLRAARESDKLGGVPRD